MIVIAIIAFLSMIAVPSFSRLLAKSKRAEAYMNLSSLYMAEKAYWVEHGRYTTDLGPGGLNWQPEGYKGGGPQENFYYTYGFSTGQEGKNYFTGKLKATNSELMQTFADEKGFSIAAAADIDGDGVCDVLVVNQFNEIKILNSDV